MKVKFLHLQCLVFMFVFLSCSFIFLGADDLVASNSLYMDLPNKIKEFYLGWCARIPPILLTYLLLHKNINFLTVPLLNLTTAFFFVYFLKKLYELSFDTKQPTLLGYCIFSVCLIYYLTYTAAWYEAILWKTGAIFYFYGITFGLIIMDRLFIQEKMITNKQTNKHIMTYFFLGLILGCWLELLALFILSIYFLFFLYQIYSVPLNRLFSKIQLSFLIGTISGLSIILTAPGTWNRKNLAANMVNVSNDSILYKLNFAFSHYFQYKIKLYLASFLFFTVLFILINYTFLKTISRMEKKIIFNFSLFFLSLLALSSFAYTYEGCINGRVTLLYDVLLFVGFMQAFFYIIQNKKYSLSFNTNHNKLAIMTLILTLGYPLVQYYRSYSYYAHQIHAINSLEDKSAQDVKLYNRNIKGFLDLGLSSDPKAWQNQVFAKYYGIKSVVIN